MKTYLVLIDAGCVGDNYSESYLVRANSPEEAIQDRIFDNFKHFYSPFVSVISLDKAVNRIEEQGSVKIDDIAYDYFWKREDE